MKDILDFKKGFVNFSLKMLTIVWLSVASLALSFVYADYPSYLVDTSPCLKDADCPGDPDNGGLVCWQPFDGCSRGQCRCNPSTHIMHNGRCLKKVYGGEYCTSADVCPEGMHCVEGTCLCARGHMTSDGLFCTQAYARLLGDACSSQSDTCWRKTDFGFTREGTECSSDDVCRCTDGYRADNQHCHKWRFGEWGCTASYQCEGGALCVDRQCRCPEGYHHTNADTKCAKMGAIYNLPLGQNCDELNERRYCGQGLLCHQCQADAPYRCVRYSIDTAGHISSSTRLAFCPLLLLSLTTVPFLVKTLLTKRTYFAELLTLS